MNRAVRDEIQRIADHHNGRITPEQVVESASHPTSPLHDLFEWDNKQAGHKYRLGQARAIIRSMTVKVTVESRKVSTVAFVRDPAVDAKTQGYVSVGKIRTDEDAARDVLIAEFSRVNAALIRAHSLARVFALQDDVDRLRDEAEALSRRALDAVPTFAMAAA